jgi:hypothetical protein
VEQFRCSRSTQARARSCRSTGTVKSIQIVFDEGQDASGALDQFGLAVLDNIDVNGMLVGRGNGPHK